LYKILVRRPEGKRSTGIPWNIWENNTKMGIAEKGCNEVDWIHLTLGQVVISCENSIAITSFQRMTCSMKLVNI